MNLKQRYGSTALVAVASEGIGVAFATLLAAEGINLVFRLSKIDSLKQMIV